MNDDFDPKGIDAEGLEEAQLQARELLEEALDQISEAAFVLATAVGLIDGDEDDYEIDEDELEATGDATLIALSQVLEGLYLALDSLPGGEDDEDDFDDEEEFDDGDEDDFDEDDFGDDDEDEDDFGDDDE